MPAVQQPNPLVREETPGPRWSVLMAMSPQSRSLSKLNVALNKKNVNLRCVCGAYKRYFTYDFQ